MNQTLKGIVGLAALEMRFWAMLAKFGRSAPVPKSPILRNVAGLPETVQATDGAQLRAAIGAADLK